MSRLARTIEAVQTKNREYKIPPLIHVTTENFIQPNHFKSDYILQEYRVEARFGMRMLSELGNDITHTHKLRQCKRQIVEAVFGEFREDFIAMFKALSEQNLDEAYNTLEKFHDKMYGVDE